MPVELHNVTMQQRPVFVAGNASTVGMAAMGVAAATMWGRARQKKLEGQVRWVPATGEVALTDDRVVLRLTATGKVPGVRITGDPAARTIEQEIPYGLLKRFGTERHGVYLDVFGQNAVWIQPQDRGEFTQWLAHLSYGKTWTDPAPVEVRQELAVADWCQDSRFVFGLPAGWVRPPAAGLGQQAAACAPWILRAAVCTELGDWEAQVLVMEVTGEDARNSPTDPVMMAAEFAAGTKITPLRPTQLYALDTTPGVMMRGMSSVAGASFDRTYVVVNRGGVPIVVWYTVVGGALGDGSHERWLPDFHTMLATWHWYV